VRKLSISVFALGLAAAGLVATAPAGAAAAQPQAGLLTSLVTLTPLDATSGNAALTLRAQPGEFESFQVVLRGAAAAALPGATVSVAPFAGPSGSSIGGNDLTVFREAYTRVRTPSDQEGWCQYWNPASQPFCDIPVVETPDGSFENTTWTCGGAVAPVLDSRRCLFPDALIPERDAFYGEDRSAFPVDVPAGENRVAWVDVHVPAGATPGTYTSTVTVDGSNVDPLALDVTLQVATVALPAPGSDPALDLAGGVNVNPNLCQAGAHSCVLGKAEMYRLMYLYTRASLENRMPILNPTLASAPTDDVARSLFDTWIEPLVAGVPAPNPGGLLTPERLPGARVPLLVYNRHQTAAQWQAWQQVARARGFESRMRFYCDEIGSFADSTEFDALCASPYATATGAGGWDQTPNPLRSVLIGDQAQENAELAFGSRAVLQHEITRIPLANRLHPKSGASTRGQYDGAGFLGQGADRTLWMYTSDQSTGGGNGWTPHAIWNGWPSLGGVDQPAVSEAAGPITAWVYKLTGHYYYDAFQRLGAAWNDCSATPANCIYTFGGNGDGTLYYPGTTDRIGGTHDIPIESIRLKRYRAGAETYTLLRLLEQGCGGGCSARSRATLAQIVGDPSTATGLFKSMSMTDVPATAYDTARGELLDLLPASGSTTPLPALTIADASVTEHSDGAFHAATFTVNRPGDLSEPSFAHVVVTDGTATGGVDYQPVTETVAFAAGASTAQLTVNVFADRTHETNETFVVGLADPSGAVISDPTAVGTILDDDPAGPVYRVDSSLRLLTAG
jgi:hypothetical protein